jgi:hypothetical protein
MEKYSLIIAGIIVGVNRMIDFILWFLAAFYHNIEGKGIRNCIVIQILFCN